MLVIATPYSHLGKNYINNFISNEISFYYFTSTLAPAASNFALILSASSLFTPCLRAFGAPSTKSLASFKPRPVISLATLITSIFLSPLLTRITSKSVFSATVFSAAGPATTATGAAAVTPHYSSKIFYSSAACITVSVDNWSTILTKSAIIFSF